MNRKVLGLAITALLAGNAAHAAEIYNKDGNKINLTGTVEAAYTFRGKATPMFNRNASYQHSQFTGATGSFHGLPNGANSLYRAPNSVVRQLYGNGELTDHISNEDNTMARLGFTGETQINSELTGYAKFEYQFNADHQENNTKDSDATRYAYVGLKFANYGSLDFGRNAGIVGIVRDFSDNAAKFGGDGFGGGTDIFMTGRTSSVATYSNQDFFGMVPGWNFYLQYQAKDASQGEDLNWTKEHGDGIAFTTTYEHADSGFGVGFTYANSDRTDMQRASGINDKEYQWVDSNLNAHSVMYGDSADGNNAEIWGLGAKYDANNIYFGVTYAETKNMISTGRSRTALARNDAFASNNSALDNYWYTTSMGGYDGYDGYYGDYEVANKTKGFEVVANYTFDFGLTPSIVYNQQRGYDLHGFQNTPSNPQGLGDAYLVKYLGLGAKYAFNKNMDAAIGYKINLLDKDAEYSRRHNLATDDTVEMRLTYSF